MNSDVENINIEMGSEKKALRVIWIHLPSNHIYSKLYCDYKHTYMYFMEYAFSGP